MRITNRKHVKPFVTLDGSCIRELVSYRTVPVRGFSIAEAVVAPGKETRSHHHTRSQEIYFILSGTGRMYIEKESHTVKKNDTIIILPREKHRIRNTGKKNLVFLCVCSPCYEHVDTMIAT